VHKFQLETAEVSELRAHCSGPGGLVRGLRAARVVGVSLGSERVNRAKLLPEGIEFLEAPLCAGCTQAASAYSRAESLDGVVADR
jgi:hypothetical protein